VTEYVGVLAPGFIDLHLHGAAGHDTMDASPRGLAAMAAHAASHGTTAFLATTVCAPEAELLQAIGNVAGHDAGDGARVLGVHLEGPYLNHDYAGAQSTEAMVRPDLDQAVRLVTAYPGCVRRVTLAPELPGALELAGWLHRQNILVSAGHTGADYEQMLAAHAAGVRAVTHLFNAMRGLHHREPGAVGAALLSGKYWCELIIDGHHLHPDVAHFVCQRWPERVFLATDAVRGCGLAAGSYRLGPRQVYVEQGAAFLPGGVLAGSVLTMDQAVRNAVGMGLTLGQAVDLASGVPARALGCPHSGRLAAGAVADLVLLSPELGVEATFVGGRLVYGSV
jgi:N-acetylglucosamine-6-phosphate deacetylase